MNHNTKHDDASLDIAFSSPEHALHWSEEKLSRVGVRPMQTLLEGITAGGGTAWDEVQEHAETIIVCLSMVDDHRGREAYRAAHSVSMTQGLDVLLGWLVSSARQAGVAGDHRTPQQLEAAAEVALIRARQKSHGWKVAPMSRYAEALGIKRQSLASESARVLVDHLESTVASWVERGERDFVQRLKDAHIELSV